jgi:hypothetical protein
MPIQWGFTKLSQFSRMSVRISAILLLVLAGCQRRSDVWHPGKGFRTQIIVGHSTGYAFQEVELKGVEDKSNLAGQVVNFYFAPGMKDNRPVGNHPLTHFIHDHGVYIPADQMTLQMVTLYYNLQQLKELELSATHSQTSIVQWPRNVALSVRVINAPDMRFDNAFYNSDSDTLYFVPYKDSGFPIPLNPGIVAHEHFHSYFYKQVLQPLATKSVLPQSLTVTDFHSSSGTTDLYNLYVMKIMNEGLADVWGWIYSQDPDFVALSLPKTGVERALEKPNPLITTRLVSEENLKNELNMIMFDCGDDTNKCIAGDSYIHGNALARGMKAFASVYAQDKGLSQAEVRLVMAEKILSLIQKVQETMSANKTISLDDVVSLFSKQFTTLSSDACDVLKQTTSSAGAIVCGSSTSSSAQ